MQTRIGSAIETALSVTIGLMTAWALNKWFMPAIGIQMSTSQNWLAVGVFTVVSMIRQFSVRRLFNWLSERFGF